MMHSTALRFVRAIAAATIATPVVTSAVYAQDSASLTLRGSTDSAAVQPGTRVRVTDKGRANPLLLHAPGRVSGILTGLRQDTLTLSLASGAVRSFPVGAVGTLEVSRGAYPPMQGAVRGIGQGVVLSVVALPLVFVLDGAPMGSAREMRNGALTIGVGALVGALYGAVRPSERWQRVEITDP